MADRTIVGFFGVVVAVMIVAAAVVLYLGPDFGNEDVDDDIIDPAIQEGIDTAKAEALQNKNTVENDLKEFIEEKVWYRPETKWIDDIAFEYRDSGKPLRIAEIYGAQPFDSTRFNYHLITDVSLEYNKILHHTTITSDTETIIEDNMYFNLLTGFRGYGDFTMMMWFGSSIFAEKDCVIQSLSGDILYLKAGYNVADVFHKFEPWIFPSNVYFAGIIMPAPEDSQYPTTSVQPAVVLEEGGHAIMKTNNGYIDLATRKTYDSVYMQFDWSYREYSGYERADIGIVLDAYSKYIEAIKAGLQVEYDAIVTFYNMDPSERTV